MDGETISMPAKESLTVIDGVYVLKRKLGQGGMAAVYLADVDLLRFDYTALYAYTQVQGATHLERRQKAEELAGKLTGKTLDPGTVRTLLIAQGIPVPGAEVALKVAIGEADTARFEVEWKSLLCLNHPNVVQVYGGGMQLGRPYYSMELLDRIVTPGRVKTEFTIAQKMQVIIQAARGLAYLHSNGIVHRDVKPDNAVVCETLPGEFVTKITDLGIAKQLELDGMTLAKTAMGTPHYMSPEQFASSKDIDRRADIYSLGATLYELVSGVKPYHNLTTVFEIFRAVTLHTPPAPASQHNPALPEAVVGIIECAMAWDPDCRYQKMEELIKDVEKYLADEDIAVTRAVAFNAESKAKSVARIGKDKYAFERYRRKAAARAHLAQAKPGAAPVAAGAVAAKSVAATPVRKEKSWRPLLIGGSVAALLAVVAGLVIAYQATKRSRPGRPVPSTVAARRAPPTLPAPKPAPVAKPPVVSVPAPAPVVTGAEAKMIAELHAALKAKNPEYNGQGEFKIEDGKIVEVAFWPFPCGVRDLSPLRGLPLRSFRMQGGQVADLGPLKGMPLEHLDLLGCPVGDLRPLAGMRLTTLGLGGCGKVDSLEPLRGMPLTKLHLQFNARKDLDLSPLADSRIEELSIGCYEDTPSLAVLRNMPLRRLTLPDARELPDMAPLSGKTLESLCVFNFKGRDLSPLGNLSCKELWVIGGPNLVDVDVAALKNVQVEVLNLNNITGVTDLACLADTKIKTLRVMASPIRDLAFVRDLPDLEVLHVEGCASIKDLTPLAGLRLKVLGFTLANITKGIEAVRGMTTLREIRPDAGQNVPRYFSPAEFWKRYDAGEFGKPGSAATGTPVPAPAPAATGADAKLIADLHAALKAKNPEYNGQGKFEIRNSQVVTADLLFCGVSDLTPLAGLPLKTLNAEGCRIHDLSPLKGMPLEQARLSGDFADLSALSGMTTLVELRLSSVELADLSPLQGLDFYELVIRNCPKVTDVSPLAGAVIGSLVASGIAEKRGLDVLRKRGRIGMIGKELDSLRPAADFWRLYDQGQLKPPVPIAPDVVHAALRARNPEYNGKAGVHVARGFVQITVKDCGVKDFSGLASLPVTAINCSTSGIADLRSLKGFPLISLVCASNAITDLSPLAGMNLWWLDITDNRVTDLGPLRDLPLLWLNCAGNSITDLGPLVNLPLRRLTFTPGLVTKGLAAIRENKTINEINGMPAAEFWKRYDAGEFGKPGSAAKAAQ